MGESQVVVYEKSANWSRLIRPLCEHLREVRSLQHLCEAVNEHTRLIAVEVTSSTLIATLDTVQALKLGGRSVPIATVAIPDRSLRDFDASMYEFGFDAIVRSRLDLERISRLLASTCDRFIDHSVGDADEMPLRDWAWTQIPWKRHAAGGSHSPPKRNNKE